MEKVRKGLFFETLYADDLVLMTDFIESILKKFANWKDSLNRLENQQVSLKSKRLENQQLKNKIDVERFQRRATNQ